MIDLIVRLLLILSPGVPVGTLRPLATAIAVAVDDAEEERGEVINLIVLNYESGATAPNGRFSLPPEIRGPRMWMARAALRSLAQSRVRCRSASMASWFTHYRTRSCTPDAHGRWQANAVDRLREAWERQ